MKHSVEKKIGDKEVKVDVETGYILEHVKIHGDVTKNKKDHEVLEDALMHCHHFDTEHEIAVCIKNAVEKHKIKLEIKPENLAKVIKEAMRGSHRS